MKRTYRFLLPFVGLALFAGACGDDGAADDDDDSSGSEDSADDDDSDPSATATVTATATDPDSGDVSSGSEESGSESESGTAESETGSACGVTPPDAWAAPDWDANTTDALVLRAGLDALVGEMRLAEQGMATIEDVQELVDLFEAGTPSVSSVTTAGYAPIVQASFEEFVDLAAAGDQDLIDDGGQWVPGAAGGIFGTSDRGMNEGGLEVRQLVDKGLFSGGALYNQAASLTTGTIDEATIDSLAALYGANNALGTGEGELTDAANYSFQMGFHAEIAEALIAAKAYAAVAECEAERDEAIRTFFRTWELAMFARLVFYANEAAAGVELAVADDDFAAALHELAEGMGLALGFYGLEHPDAGPLAGEGHVVTDAQLDSIAAALRIDLTDLGASTTGEFVENYLDFVDAVGQVEDVVAEAFALDDADIDAFRMPTAG